MALAEERIYTIDDIYELPEGQRAELIDGKMYRMAPPSYTHQKIVQELSRIIEIVSPSSRQMDYYRKLYKYQNAGVREYWIVDKEKNRVMVYSFEKGTGEEYTFEDVVPAGIYKDFWIDFKEIV